ncbi:MAG: YvcK family protein [Acidobacteriota bacterium]|nr:YvcK family protein [Acidobacteriota bacterium]
MFRIVGIGGGTGLPVLLRGLATQPGVSVSAIVTVSDNGGSSGRLRDGFGMPAVGDLRNCLVALSDPESTLGSLFQHRFTSEGGMAGSELEGHALGNLIVAALYQKTGSLIQAIELAGQIMPQRGHAMAATEMPTTLCASFRDGAVVRGECQIAAARGEIERVWLEPQSPPASRGVLDAIRTADAVVLAPGSLYTSIVPNLLVDGIADAICKSAAVKIMVCNLMTQPGETENYTASDHLRVLESYLGARAIQVMIVAADKRRARSRRYAAAGVDFVRFDREEILARGIVPVEAGVAERHDGRIRHDADSLGKTIVNLLQARTASVFSGAQAKANEDSRSLIPLHACV